MGDILAPQEPSLPAALARWLAARHGMVRVAVAALAGAALTLGQAPVSMPWIFFLALPVCVGLVDAARGWRGAALLGWCVGFGYFVSGLHWIGHAFVVDAERFGWMLPFAVTLFPGFLALFWAAGFGLARAVWPEGRWWRGGVLALALATVEMARGHVLTGFPWALPGYAWADTPVAQAAAWVGPYGLTLLTLVLCVVPLSAGWRGRGAVAGVAALAAFAGLWGAGMARVPDEPAYAAEAPVLRVAQPNAPQHLKWQRDHSSVFLQRLIDATAAAPDPKLGKPGLVVWPETAVTFLPQDRPDLTALIAEAAGGAPLITGALYNEGEDSARRWYNTLIALGPGGEITTRYAKHHLVPFGEYLPLRGLLTRLGIGALAGMSTGGFRAGPGPETIALPGLPAFAPAICYEMIFPRGIVAAGARPEWILHLTNDAWFGSFAGPQQHLAQARLRAIEQGLPVVRAANTGISAVIGPHGRVIGDIRLQTHGYIDRRLPAAAPATPYAIFGEIPVLLAITILWLSSLFHHSLRRPN